MLALEWSPRVVRIGVTPPWLGLTGADGTVEPIVARYVWEVFVEVAFSEPEEVPLTEQGYP